MLPAMAIAKNLKPRAITPPTYAGSRTRLTRDEVMPAGEVAELLHLPVSTVYYLARRGSFPRVGLVGRGGSCVRGSRSCWEPEHGGTM